MQEKKILFKQAKKESKSVEAYNLCDQTCSCTFSGCSGCGSVPSSDYVNVYNSRLISIQNGNRNAMYRFYYGY